jgi:hypothetical protein
MVRKRNILFVIAALILIPIFLGLTPVRFFQKLGCCCPFNQNKAALSCDPCIYNSVTSQSETGNLALAALPSTPFVFQSSPLLYGETVGSVVPIVSNLFSESPPLRC